MLIFFSNSKKGEIHFIAELLKLQRLNVFFFWVPESRNRTSWYPPYSDLDFGLESFNNREILGLTIKMWGTNRDL